MSSGIVDEIAEAAPAVEWRSDVIPEENDALVRRAKDIISGRSRPGPMAVPPAIERFFQQQFKDRPPTPEAVRHLSDHAILDALGGGVYVAYTATADNCMALLAVGEDGVRALLRGVTPQERSRVVVTVTDVSVR